MRENFLHFLSSTPATLDINGKYLGYIDNVSSNEIDVITRTSHIFGTYSPASDTTSTIPYTFLLHTLNAPESNNQYIKVVPFPNNNYDIIMKPFYYYQVAEPTVLFNESRGKYFVSIVCDNVCKITIFSGGSIVYTTNAPILSEVKVDEDNGILIIEGIVDSDKFYLLIIDTSNFEVLHNDIVQSIENDSKTISSYKKLNTLCHHAKVFSLNIPSKKAEQYYVYEENASNYLNPYLIPNALLQCVSVKDESKSQSFLGENLLGTPISKLSEYFGDIKNIYFNRHNISHKLNYTIETNTMKNYNFLIRNNKIIDIEENF